MRKQVEHDVVMAIKDMRMGKKAVPVTPLDEDDASLGEEVDLEEEV